MRKKETMMYHPLIARELAAAHIRDLTSQAGRSRLAALARCSRPGRRPGHATRARPCPGAGPVTAAG
ncbi:MAG: hypothetical protein ACRDNT_22770 [Streptosporangiaceae bacterium]